jgi:predicted small metal-binding protein
MDRTKVIKCDCGYVARGRNNDELARDAQKHVREVHKMEITREQALAMAQFE